MMGKRKGECVKKRLLSSVLSIGLLVGGTALIIDLTSSSVEGMAAITRALGPITAKLGFLGQIVVRVSKDFDETLKRTKYNDRVFKPRINVVFQGEQRAFGLDYDFWFRGSGPLLEGFEPVDAYCYPKFKFGYISAGARALDVVNIGKAFLTAGKNITKNVGGGILGAIGGSVIKKLVNKAADTLFKPAEKLIELGENLLRLDGISVGMVKLYLLFQGAGNPYDPVKMTDIPYHLVIIMLRTALTEVEDPTAAQRKTASLLRVPDVTGFLGLDKKDKILYKDLGKISPVFQRPGFKLVRDFLGDIDVPVPVHVYGAWKDRAKRRKPSLMQKYYSTMRRVEGYTKKTLYAQKYIVKLMKDVAAGRKKWSMSDKELLIKAMRVHTARVYSGVAKVLGVEIFSKEELANARRQIDAAAEGGAEVIGGGEDDDVDADDVDTDEPDTEDAETDDAETDDAEESEETEDDDETPAKPAAPAKPTSTSVIGESLENDLFITKMLLKERLAGLIGLLTEVVGLATRAGLTANQKKVLANLLAQIKGDLDKLAPVVQEIEWTGKLPSNKTLDELAVEEEPALFAPESAGKWGGEDPFSSVLSVQEKFKSLIQKSFGSTEGEAEFDSFASAAA